MADLTNTNELYFPLLPIDDREDTKNCLHLFFQIVVKIHLASFPKKTIGGISLFIFLPGDLQPGQFPYVILV